MIKYTPEDYQTQPDKLYGIYRGVIEDNNDPQKLGRCKVRIFGIHTEMKNKNELEGIPTEELPWSEPALGLFEGSVSGFGSWTVPLQGSHVFLFFENGHILNPRFFASAPGMPTNINHGFEDNEGFSDPDNEYPNEETQYPHKPNQLNESDYHRLARNDNIDETIVNSKNENRDVEVNTADGDSWDEPESYYNSSYPDNKVFSTNSGITIELDDTNGEERIHIYHPSNTYIEINNEGNVILRNAKNKFEIVDNDKKQHIMNNLDCNVDSNETRDVGIDRITHIGNNEDITIDNNRDKYVNVDETMEIGNNRDTTIGNNDTTSVGNNDTKTVGSDKQCDTSGTVTHTSGGNYNINAGGVLNLHGTAVNITNSEEGCEINTLFLKINTTNGVTINDNVSINGNLSVDGSITATGSNPDNHTH